MQGSWNKALENYIKALELESEPNSGFIHLGLAICYKNLNNVELYTSECKLAHNLLSVEGMNEFILSCLEAICGKSENSIRLLEIALNKRQTNVELILKDPYLKDIINHSQFRVLRSRFEFMEPLEIIPFM
jgi:tetratricopeptide (TPR) repeat protein